MYTWSATLKLEYGTLLLSHSEKEKSELLDQDKGFKVRGTHGMTAFGSGLSETHSAFGAIR